MYEKNKFSIFEKLEKIKPTIKKLNNFDVRKKDVENLIFWLSKYWNIEVVEYPENKKGPYLVIFKENHYNNNVKSDNVNAFMEVNEYFNFLANEWWSKETKYEQLNLNNFNKKINFIVDNKYHRINISSNLIERILWNSIMTIWVDLDRSLINDLIKANNKKYSEIEKLKREINNPFLTNNWKKITTNKNNLKLLEKKFNKEVTEKYVLNARNTIWLNNISKLLTQWIWKWRWKNFIPIICWAAHAKWLSNKAWQYWFKWVIIFTPKSLKK